MLTFVAARHVAGIVRGFALALVPVALFFLAATGQDPHTHMRIMLFMLPAAAVVNYTFYMVSRYLTPLRADGAGGTMEMVCLVAAVAAALVAAFGLKGAWFVLDRMDLALALVLLAALVAIGHVYHTALHKAYHGEVEARRHAWLDDAIRALVAQLPHNDDHKAAYLDLLARADSLEAKESLYTSLCNREPLLH